MKYLKYTILFFAMFSFALQAQIAPDKYWIQFTDKNNSPYSIDNPQDFLSERALQRRANQNISIDEKDIPVNPQYLQAVADAGATLFFPSKWLNGVTIETADQNVLDAIMALPFVESSLKLENDPLKHEIKQKTFFANETYSTESLAPVKSGKNTGSLDYGMGYTQINQLNGIGLHDMGYQGEGMIVAVLDGGFIEVDTHPAFENMREEGRLLGTKDFVYPGGSVFCDSYHGTGVLSCMGANVPGTFIGTAPRASFYLIHTENTTYENLIEEFNWVSGAEYADSLGVDVINSSLGYITFDDPTWDHTYQDMNGNTTYVTLGADIACEKGILVVNSAGNEGSDYFYPYIGAPADGFNVFSIGAVKSNGERASFSSIGPSYDGRTKPDVMAMGQGSTVASSYGNYGESSGTSFSSPILAGMVTCLWQANQHFTNAQIRDAIRMSGNRASNPDNEYGYGIPDFVLANEILVSISETTTNSEKTLFNVNPNPVRNSVKIATDNAVSFSLYDVSGRILCEVNANEISKLEMVICNLKSGVYLLKADFQSDSQTEKIVKM